MLAKSEFCKPFVKWVGGKGQLLTQLENYYPLTLKNGQIEQYIEPFVGGGAVFFAVMQKYHIKSAYISDINSDLILAYRVIQKYPERLIELLEQKQKIYNNTPEQHRQALFLSIRTAFNQSLGKIVDQQILPHGLERVAQFIFLNKMCFNGLFRLNAKGEFNVPFGKYQNPNIINANNILAVSALLSNVEIKHGDYRECFTVAHEKSFVYLDPPYRPLSTTASFTTYSVGGFNDNDQIELAHFFRRLDQEKQCQLMLSNSDPQNTQDDHFFIKWYTGYLINKVFANRMVNCDAKKRGKISELLITNYNVKQVQSTIAGSPKM